MAHCLTRKSTPNVNALLKDSSVADSPQKMHVSLEALLGSPRFNRVNFQDSPLVAELSRFSA